MKTVLSCLLFLCFSVNTSAQMINGRVMNERGLNEASINVSFRNKANSVITRADGTFEIRATKLPDTLVFTAVGFEPYEVVVTEKTVKDPKFEIVLLDSRGRMSETTMSTTALGTRRVRKSTTYATTDRPVVDDVKTESLRGMVSGVRVSYDDEPSARYNTDKKLHIGGTLYRDSVAPRSKLLTAGEVNDFNKWKMWEDFNQTDFKTWGAHWNIFMQTRYSVQLQHKDNTAVIGQMVYLVNRTTNDTVWAAVSDNTGKAELWAGIDSEILHVSGQATGKNDLMLVSGSEVIRNPSPFVNGLNRMRFANNCNISNRVEIAFAVDATGSMGDEIEFMKLELEDVIRKTFDNHKELDVNFGSVFYKDKGDEYVTKHIPLQNDLLKVLNFIKLQSAGGGGDEPEAVHAALRSALEDLNWSKDARARLLFFILDAPPHDGDKKEMIELMKKAAAMGVRVIPLICSGGSKSAEYLMRCIALATNGTYTFLTNHSGIGGDHTKPSTDAFTVETLNTLMQRIIEQMIFAVPCDDEKLAAPVRQVPVNSEKVKIYPNPTRGNVIIESDKELKQVFVTDFTGKILLNLAEKGKRQWKVDLTNYPAGTYLIKYVTKEDTWGGEKIIKMH